MQCCNKCKTDFSLPLLYVDYNSLTSTYIFLSLPLLDGRHYRRRAMWRYREVYHVCIKLNHNLPGSH